MCERRKHKRKDRPTDARTYGQTSDRQRQTVTDRDLAISDFLEMLSLAPHSSTPPSEPDSFALPTAA